MAELPEFLTPGQAAALLKCSAGRIYKLYHDGDLEGFKNGGRVFIFASSVPAFVDRQRNKTEVEMAEAKRTAGRATPKKAGISAPGKIIPWRLSPPSEILGTRAE